MPCTVENHLQYSNYVKPSENNTYGNEIIFQQEL